ncbi:hypothetical protein [Berryella wangjianweii]|uniref:hypothetical protein n=1 Tax=Berryella wangjianweii TaxID=2734634 RepID=UPI001563A14E|nr:hypothetical protein [Berryella wangjianweii]
MDRTVESFSNDVPDIPAELRQVLLYMLTEARDRMLEGNPLDPFTALAIGDKLFMETHPAGPDDDAEACFKAARKTVGRAHGATAYGFCYDGYVEADDRTLSAIIAEGGVPGAGGGVAVGYLYEEDDQGALTFEADPTFIGVAPNFMIHTSRHVTPVSGDDAADAQEPGDVQPGPAEGSDDASATDGPSGLDAPVAPVAAGGPGESSCSCTADDSQTAADQSAAAGSCACDSSCACACGSAAPNHTLDQAD